MCATYPDLLVPFVRYCTVGTIASYLELYLLLVSIPHASVHLFPMKTVPRPSRNGSGGQAFEQVPLVSETELLEAPTQPQARGGAALAQFTPIYDASSGPDIPTLVAALAGDNPGTTSREDAARRLAELSGEERDCQSQIVSAGAIAPLIALARDGSTQCKESAALALANLAHEGMSTRAAIASAGGIDPLVELVRSGDAQGHAHAAMELANLALRASATDSEGSVHLAPSESISSLIPLVTGTGHSKIKEHAALALAHLAAQDPDNQAAITAAGAIPPLVALIRNGDTFGSMRAAQALGDLAANNRANQTAIAACGGIAALVVLLKGAPQHCKWAAAIALGHLAHDHEANQAAIVAAEGVPHLVALESTGDAQGKDAAAAALRRLSDYGANSNNEATITSARRMTRQSSGRATLSLPRIFDRARR